MKQGQSPTTRPDRASHWPAGGLAGARYPLAYAPMSTGIESHHFGYWVGRLVGSILTILWAVVSLPFRLVIGIIGLLGRLVGIFLGFALMVIGMALWAGPLFILGIPLFLVGLLLTLRCLS